MVIAAPAEAAGGCASLDPFAGRWSASYLAGLGGVPHRTWGLARVSLAPIGVPGAAGGVVANLTYADPTADGYLAAYPVGGVQPATSSTNPSVIRGFGANAMVTGLSDASFDLYASVSTDAVVDVWGRFTS